jgi:hypothetical protein
MLEKSENVVQCIEKIRKNEKKENKFFYLGLSVMLVYLINRKYTLTERKFARS